MLVTRSSEVEESIKSKPIDFETTYKIKVAMTIFDGTGDFGIWKKRMLVNLSVQG